MHKKSWENLGVILLLGSLFSISIAILWTVIPLLIFGFSFILFLFVRGNILHKEMLAKERARIKGLADGSIEMTPAEFFSIRRVNRSNTEYNFVGIYIIFNKSKNMYYVGQAHTVLDRVNKHFTGSGNGDVYADYKYGDQFTIKLIALKGSGYLSLNDLERETIWAHDSFSEGYNKTRGNRQ